ncbi:RNA polymerase sigma factor [uncultured Sphingomonas sp.]|uniref:RNA polymerase sigma factor n=1 Tax=uncultured Sphingomonas sp. TaxID=158754 RepID=UPI0025CF65D2|nr:RNA polymerase sigma factor [uncultured Sphingomonas sp.]
MPPTGLEAVFLAHRDTLVRFLRARGAGDTAEDLVQDLWLKLSGRMDGPIANPLAYLYRAADMLMIDRYRARRQAERREQDWAGDQDGTEPPAAERAVVARQTAERVATTLAALGERPATVFRRVRVDGIAQRQVAAELGVSLSTVESDLRMAAQALAALKEQIG